MVVKRLSRIFYSIYYSFGRVKRSRINCSNIKLFCSKFHTTAFGWYSFLSNINLKDFLASFFLVLKFLLFEFKTSLFMVHLKWKLFQFLQLKHNNTYFICCIMFLVCLYCNYSKNRNPSVDFSHGFCPHCKSY